MQIAFPEIDSIATINFHRDVSVGDFEAFCAENPSLRAQLSAQGEITIMPPAGGESSYQSANVCIQLGSWALINDRGKVFDSSAAFVLPLGSILSPDTAWVSDETLQSLDPPQRRRFLRLVPDFVVEVMSPTDRIPAVELKMAEWMANGVPLAWLINGDQKSVTIYRPQQQPQILSRVNTVAGEGPLEGFTLNLTRIWAGL